MINKALKANQEKINGIIQVGANIGQELKILTKYSENIYLFEPLTEAFDLLTKNISQYSNIQIFKYALGEKSEIKKINISNENFSASSSLLEPSLHLDYFPEIKFDNFEEVKVKRFDEIDFKFNANFLILDVQGYELYVVKGFGEYIKNIDFIFTEVSTKELYKNSVLIVELDSILSDLGYVRTKTKIASNKPQGDALYIRAENLHFIKFYYYKFKSVIQISRLYLLLNFIKDYKKIIYLLKSFLKKIINKK